MDNDLELENLLTALTDSALTDASPRRLEAVARQYAVPRTEADGFIRLIARLTVTMQGARPAPRFVQRLKTDLAGDDRPRDLIYRARHLPAHVQLAAGLAVVVGFVLLRRRQDDHRRSQTETVPVQ
jgi:hypothetical protein